MISRLHPSEKHAIFCADVAGKPVGYKLMATPNPIILADPNSMIGRRAIFATKNLWVTPHSESERFPAGDYTLGSKGNVGLSEWTKQVIHKDTPFSASIAAFLLCLWKH